MKTQNYFIHCAVMFITCSLAIYMTSCKDNADKDVGESLVSVKRTPMRVVDSLECLYGIPFASDDELLQYSYYYNPECYSEYGVLSYQFARDYGFAEFIGHIGTYLYHRNNILLEYYSGRMDVLSISQKPVIVYDYDNRPFYYEFPIIYRENELVGTITVAAQPFNTEIIHYMFPNGLTYNQLDRRYRRYVGEYPCVYYSNDIGNSFMKAYSNESGEISPRDIGENYYIADLHDAMLAKIDELNQNELSNIAYDLQQQEYLEETDHRHECLTEYVNSFASTEETQEFWEQKISEYYSSSHDDLEISEIVMQWAQENISEIEASYQGFLPEYNEHRLRFTRWEGYCGPAIMAWLYRGKYNSYNERYLPLFQEFESYNWHLYPDIITYDSHLAYYIDTYANETQDDYVSVVREKSYNTDNGLFYAFFQYTDEVCGEYPLLDWGLRASLPEVTYNQYHIKFITAPITWLKNKQQPVVVEGIRGHAHYCGAIGYSYDQWWFIKYYMRLFVVDNGFFTQYHHHYPYWSILGGLNYAWVLNE